MSAPPKPWEQNGSGSTSGPTQIPVDSQLALVNPNSSLATGSPASILPGSSTNVDNSSILNGTANAGYNSTNTYGQSNYGGYGASGMYGSSYGGYGGMYGGGMYGGGMYGGGMMPGGGWMGDTANSLFRVQQLIDMNTWFLDRICDNAQNLSTRASNLGQQLSWVPSSILPATLACVDFATDLPERLANACVEGGRRVHRFAVQVVDEFEDEDSVAAEEACLRAHDDLQALAGELGSPQTQGSDATTQAGSLKGESPAPPPAQPGDLQVVLSKSAKAKRKKQRPLFQRILLMLKAIFFGINDDEIRRRGGPLGVSRSTKSALHKAQTRMRVSFGLFAVFTLWMIFRRRGVGKQQAMKKAILSASA